MADNIWTATVEGIAARGRANNGAEGDYRDEEGFLCCGKCRTRKEGDITIGEKTLRVPHRIHRNNRHTHFRSCTASILERLRRNRNSGRYSGSIPEPSLFMTRIGATPSETSCLISNLFTEIRPVCGHCEGDSVVLCGVTYEGQEETVVLRDYGFDYSGDPETVENIRKRRCIYGNKKKLPADFE